MLCLKHIEGRTYDPSLQPEKVLLKPTVTRFGRCNESSDVVIDSSISPLMISRLHAEIRFVDGKYRIDCRGMNGMIVNQKKRSSAVLCEGDEIVFGGIGVKKKVKEGQIVRSYDSELVYVFVEVRPSSSEEPDSLGEGTSDGKVRRRSKRKQPVSTSEELLLSDLPADKNKKSKKRGKEVSKDQDVECEKDSHKETRDNEKDGRSKKYLSDLNEELLCCICRELMVLSHALPCSHTFCYSCIRDWLSHSGDCPNCRASTQLKLAVPVKVLDNTIDKVAAEVLTAEELKERELKKQEMSEEVKKKKVEVLTVSSESDSDSDDSVDLDFLLWDGVHFHLDHCYSVEHARSGRARCRTCFAPIAFRSLRWIVDFKTRWEHLPQTHFHHLECFLPPPSITYDYLAFSPQLSREEKRQVRDMMEAR